MEPRDNSGALFKNARKTTDRHPDLTGRLQIGGVSYRLAAWKKPGKDGKPSFLSLAVSRDEPQDDDASPF